jgi:NADP-dependent 3-hydroxy acid dehydrogenase YdfG
MAAYAYEPISLFGKGVVITGGTTGIGRSTAQCLVSEGAHVLIFGRHEQELQDALADIESVGVGSIHGLTADQSRYEDVQRVFEAADKWLGNVDVLINNAAVGAGCILNSDYDEWKYVVETNLLGYMACCKLALERMVPRREGHIVNVGSLSAKVTEPDSNVYVATKSAVRGFTESLRKKVNEMGIKVSLIEPGLVGTDMSAEKTPPEKQAEEEAEGKMLKAEDVAECICYALTQPWRCDVMMVQLRPHFQVM